MPKSKKAVAPTDWENASENNGEYESLPSGLAPLWKPKEGNTILFRADAVHSFKVKKGAKKRTKAGGTNFAVEGIFCGGETMNFFSNKNKPAEISIGDRVTLGSSYNLIGEDRLIIVDDGEANLSPMANLILQEGKAFRIKFDGKVPTGGGRSVNTYDIAVPSGFRSKLVDSKTSQKSKK